MKVLLFARLKDLAGCGEVEIALAPGSRVVELRQKIVELHPALASLLPKCAVAINDEYADDDVTIGVSDRIALLPPVSGG